MGGGYLGMSVYRGVWVLKGVSTKRWVLKGMSTLRGEFPGVSARGRYSSTYPYPPPRALPRTIARRAVRKSYWNAHLFFDHFAFVSAFARCERAFKQRETFNI